MLKLLFFFLWFCIERSFKTNVLRLGRKRRERSAAILVELSEKLDILETGRVYEGAEQVDSKVHHVTDGTDDEYWTP